MKAWALTETGKPVELIDQPDPQPTGGGLAHNLAETGQFPRLALQMVSVGEETGQLDVMLMKVADTYDKEVRNTIDRLLAIFTPFITLLMAVMIGTIVMSVLVAILGINDLVG